MGYLEHIWILAIDELFRCTLRLDINHTVGALRTPDIGGGGTLEHVDALYVLWVDIDEFCKLLLVGGREVEFVGVGSPYVAIDDDEGFAGAMPLPLGSFRLYVFLMLWRSHHHQV